MIPRHVPFSFALEFPVPAKPWSTNQERRWHWTKYRPLIDLWKKAAWAAFLLERNGLRDVGRVPLPPSRVVVTIPFDVSERQWESKARDPHNYTGTVVKAVIDGLVYAGAWPDDTPEWVWVPEPFLVRGDTVRIVTMERVV